MSSDPTHEATPKIRHVWPFRYPSYAAVVTMAYALATWVTGARAAPIVTVHIYSNNRARLEVRVVNDDGGLRIVGRIHRKPSIMGEMTGVVHVEVRGAGGVPLQELNLPIQPLKVPFNPFQESRFNAVLLRPVPGETIWIRLRQDRGARLFREAACREALPDLIGGDESLQATPDTAGPAPKISTISTGV